MPRNYTTQKKIDIDFSWMNDDSDNTARYELTCAAVIEDVTSKASLTLPPGYRLVRQEKEDSDSFEIYLLCDTSKEVVYYIECNVLEDINFDRKPVTQVLLWRTLVVDHRAVTSEIPEKIFRNYLLESYNVIASDTHHTAEGRTFWTRQLGYALQYGEFVYRYDRMSGALLQLTDHAVIRTNSCDLWGDEQHYENILAIISKEAL